MSKKIKNIKKYTLKKVTLDPLYRSYWYSKFSNKLMLNGKKHIIEKLLSQLLYKFKLKYRVQPITLLFVSLIRLKPLLGFVQKRVGSVWKSVPIPLKPREQLVLSLKWLINQIKLEPEITLRARILNTFALLLRRKSRNKRIKRSALLTKKRIHYFKIVKDRVNSRFRWR